MELNERDPLIICMEIAMQVGGARPTVTIWEKRHGDLPPPVRSGGAEYFHLSEGLTWMGVRTGPRSQLRPGEAMGTAYRDRIQDRQGLQQRPATREVETRIAEGSTGISKALVNELIGSHADRVRGLASMLVFLKLLLSLVGGRPPAGECLWSSPGRRRAGESCDGRRGRVPTRRLRTCQFQAGGRRCLCVRTGDLRHLCWWGRSGRDGSSVPPWPGCPCVRTPRWSRSTSWTIFRCHTACRGCETARQPPPRLPSVVKPSATFRSASHQCRNSRRSATRANFCGGRPCSTAGTRLSRPGSGGPPEALDARVAHRMSLPPCPPLLPA